MQQLAFTIDERLQERMTRAEMTHLQVVVFSRMPGAATALHKIRSCDCDPVAPCASRSCKIQRRPQDHSKRIHIQEQKWKSQNPARWKRRLPILPEGATSRCRHEVRSADTVPCFLGIPSKKLETAQTVAKGQFQKSDPDTYLAKSVTRTGFAQPGKGWKVSRMDDGGWFQVDP